MFYYLNSIINIFKKYPLWILGFVYGKLVTNSLFKRIKNISFRVKKDIYIIENEKPILVSIKQINTIDTNKYYVGVTLNLDDVSIEKILVFNDKTKLIEKYANLENFIKKDLETFSNLMEICLDEKDITELFKKYTSKSKYFKEITDYSLKSNDIYDFEKKKFIINKNSKLIVTDMNLQTFTYIYDQELN